MLRWLFGIVEDQFGWIVIVACGAIIIFLFRKVKKNELSNLGCAISSILTVSVGFIVLIFGFIIFGIRSCNEQNAEESEYWKDKSECDCINAYEKYEILFDDLIMEQDVGFVTFGSHPCKNIVYLTYEAFNDNLKLTKLDTIAALKRLCTEEGIEEDFQNE